MSSSTIPNPTYDTLHRELMVGKLELHLEQQRSNEMYLGNADVLDRVTWIDANHGHRLVPAGVIDFLQQSNTDDTKDATPNLSQIPSAELCVIARISRDDCWLAPDGFWKGPTNITKHFSDVKLSCAGEAPGYQDFDDEFNQSLQNLRKIVDTKRTPNVDAVKGLFITSGSGLQINDTPKIKFRHPVFTRKPRLAGGAVAEPSSSDDLPSEFRIENWPAESSQAQESLQKMTRTHNVIPLPAYNVEGKLITPDEYRTQIPGAVAVIHFTLAHWSFPRTKTSEPSDTYVADIASITMLETPDPVVTPDSPSKKRPTLTDPHALNGSPSKKRKSD